MTRSEILKKLDETTPIGSTTLDGRVYNLYDIEMDGVEFSVVDSYEYGDERITLVAKDGTLIIKNLMDIEKDNIELVDIAEVYGND